jgi:hypothetical protein
LKAASRYRPIATAAERVAARRLSLTASDPEVLMLVVECAGRGSVLRDPPMGFCLSAVPRLSEPSADRN